MQDFDVSVNLGWFSSPTVLARLMVLIFWIFYFTANDIKGGSNLRRVYYKYKKGLRLANIYRRKLELKNYCNTEGNELQQSNFIQDSLVILLFFGFIPIFGVRIAENFSFITGWLVLVILFIGLFGAIPDIIKRKKKKMMTKNVKPCLVLKKF